MLMMILGLLPEPDEIIRDYRGRDVKYSTTLERASLGSPSIRLSCSHSGNPISRSMYCYIVDIIV